MIYSGWTGVGLRRQCPLHLPFRRDHGAWARWILMFDVLFIEHFDNRRIRYVRTYLQIRGIGRFSEACSSSVLHDLYLILCNLRLLFLFTYNNGIGSKILHSPFVKPSIQAQSNFRSSLVVVSRMAIYAVECSKPVSDACRALELQ